MASRLASAISDGIVVLPDGPIVAIDPRSDTDLSPLPSDRLTIVQSFRPDMDALARYGANVVSELPDHSELTIVFLPRSRALGKAWLAEAARITQGPVLVDGQKTDGIEAIAKDLRKRATVTVQISKAHGKLLGIAPDADLFDWKDTGPRITSDGFQIPTGVFSAEWPDPGSELLADCLPDKLGALVADLGAGWGFLSRSILTRESVSSCVLVEAEKRALDAARLNVPDPRARFEWADARTYMPSEVFDTVVTNPPFHTGRAASPDLGVAFIETSARILKRRGQLFLVANRHLPYERHLAALFGEVAEIGGDRSYKVLRAARPKPPGGRR